MTLRRGLFASLLSMCTAVALSAQGLRITSPAFANKALSRPSSPATARA
jgi:hypothetical protein